MLRTSDLRIEDGLTVCAAVALALTGVSISGSGDSQFWEYSFIVFPATLMILVASARYAFGEAAGGMQTLMRIGAIVRDWLPFALFLLFYETLRSQVWAGLAGHERDAALLAIDRRLFGETPAVAMQSWISPAASQFFAACYFLHLVLPPLVAFLWYRHDLRVFREFLLATLICGAVGSVCYIAIPAVGPAVAFPGLFTVPLQGSAAMQAVAMMDVLGRAPHDVFPSLHIAVSSIVLWFAFRYGRRIFVLLLPLVVGNWVSTLYLRYHYAIDDVAGFALAALSILLAAGLLALESLWRRAPEKRPATGDARAR